MGEISEAITDGDICQYCCCLLTESLGSGYGYPVSCLECADKKSEWWTVDWNHPDFKKYVKKKNFNLEGMWI